jgi:hypothetical protein
MMRNTSASGPNASSISPTKRRRVIVEDEDEDNDDVHETGSVNSNPDELLSDHAGSDEEEGEDLMNDNWMEDYAPAPELDFYDQALLARDDEPITESYEQRMAYRRSAEEELDKWDARRRQQEDEAEDALEDVNKAEEAELADFEDDEEDELIDEGERSLNLEAFQCPLREWIAEERTRKEVSRRFRKFLTTYYVGIEDERRMERNEDGQIVQRRQPPIYRSKIRWKLFAILVAAYS